MKISSTHLLFRALSSFALLIFINSCFIELGAESLSCNTSVADPNHTPIAGSPDDSGGSTPSAGDSVAAADGATCDSALATLNTAVQAANKIQGAETALLQTCAAAVGNMSSQLHMAMGMCLSTSPKLALLAPAIGGISSLSELASDPAKMCKKGADLMKFLSAGIAAYNVACAADQLMCAGSVKNLAVACKAAMESPSMSNANLGAAVTGASASCQKACGNFLPSAAAGALGAVAFLKTSLSSSKCAEALDCNQPQNYSNPTCVANCALAQNAQSPTCLCANNPNDPSCQSAYQAGATTLGTSAVGGAAIGALHMPSNLGPGGPATAPNIPVTGAGGTAAGLAGGSGNGGGGSGGGGSGGGPGAGPAGAARSASGGLAGAEAPGGLMPGGGSASNGKGGYADAAGGVGASNKFKGAMPTKSDRNTASASKEVGPRGKEIFDQMSNEYKVLGSTFYP